VLDTFAVSAVCVCKGGTSKIDKNVTGKKFDLNRNKVFTSFKFIHNDRQRSQYSKL